MSTYLRPQPKPLSELPLFAPPAQAHSPTSVAAADAIMECADTKRVAVWGFIQGMKGATDEEIQHALGMNPSTERPRRIELVRMGLVVDSGETRKTASGRSAVVWKVK